MPAVPRSYTVYLNVGDILERLSEGTSPHHVQFLLADH